MSAKTPAERREIAARSHASRQVNKLHRELARSRALAFRDGLEEQVATLTAQRNKLSKMLAISAESAGLGLGALLNEQEVVDASSPWSGCSGVYFLVCEGRVVYVGQSVNVYARIAKHRDKEFDSFTFIACDQTQLDVLEAMYIRLFHPPLNRAYPIADIRARDNQRK